MTTTDENTPGAESRGCNRMDAEGNEPTTTQMKEGSAMNVPTTIADADDLPDGWEHWFDGTIRRDRDVKSFPTIRTTLDTNPAGASLGVWVGSCETAGGPTQAYVSLEAHLNPNLTADEARQAAQHLLDAADEAEAVQAA